MAKKLEFGVKSLSPIEDGVNSPRLSCDVIFEIHKQFGIRSADMFAPLNLQELLDPQRADPGDD